MKDILQDIVAHTHSLGFLSLVKVSNEEQTKSIGVTANYEPLRKSKQISEHQRMQAYRC